MKSHHHLTPIAWARRVNRLWIVHARLGDNAEAWINHLAEHDPERLETCCAVARSMCDLRASAEDPKPWFYTGLFSLATREEAARFLSNHRITKAAIPAMADDPEVKLWLERVGPETLDLMDRLRTGLSSLMQH